MTHIEKAHALLELEYEKAQKLDYVQDAVCYAAYHAWRRLDSERKRKLKKESSYD